MKNKIKQLLCKETLRLENELNKVAYGEAFVEENKEIIEATIKDFTIEELWFYMRMNRLRLKQNKLAIKLMKRIESRK